MSTKLKEVTNKKTKILEKIFQLDNNSSIV